jgi:hypothetical protein
LLSGLAEGVVAPGVPVDRVVSVLPQVEGTLVCEVIGLEIRVDRHRVSWTVVRPMTLG